MEKRPHLQDFYDSVPRDMRPRSSRSRSARAVGEVILLYTKSLKECSIQNVIQSHEALGDSNILEAQKLARLSRIKANSLMESIDRLEGSLPIFFGIQANDTPDNFISWRFPGPVYPYEFDPNKHGFIAFCETPLHAGLEDYLKSLLTASHALGEIPIDAQAYRYKPARLFTNEKGVFYRTILTQSDGLVWFEHLNNEEQRMSQSKLMIFPKDSLKGA